MVFSDGVSQSSIHLLIAEGQAIAGDYRYWTKINDNSRGFAFKMNAVSSAPVVNFIRLISKMRQFHWRIYEINHMKLITGEDKREHTRARPCESLVTFQATE